MFAPAVSPRHAAQAFTGTYHQVAVETGRKMAPNEHMPSFDELETTLQNLKVA